MNDTVLIGLLIPFIGNCARRIENTFNKTDGRWAVADVGQKQLRLLSKHEEKECDLISLTAQAGYTMIDCHIEQK